MTVADIIIIYLAIGAPIGVLYFFDNRKKANVPRHILLSTLNVLFWFPYLFKRLTLSFSLTTKLSTEKPEECRNDSLNILQIVKIQKNLEKMITERGANLTIYEFRDLIERYIGLSLEIRKSKAITSGLNDKIDLLKFSPVSSSEIFEACLSRRNYVRLLNGLAHSRNELIRAFQPGSSFERHEQIQIRELFGELCAAVGDDKVLKLPFDFENGVGQISQTQDGNKTGKIRWNKEALEFSNESRSMMQLDPSSTTPIPQLND